MDDSLWSRISSLLEEELPPSSLESWVRQGRLISFKDNVLEIGVPSRLSRDWLIERDMGTLREAVQLCLGLSPNIRVVVDQVSPREMSAASSPPTALSPVSHSFLNPRYTFDSFVVGSSNQFAQAACLAVAELPSKAYNPLFLYGGVGLGKTHLLHAIGHHVFGLPHHPTVLYISSERFTNDLINAIRYDKTAEFRAKYRTIDLILIDDIQFLSGKERTQEEFFHTFNDLYEARKQIVLSSDSAPKEIPDLEERLRSRFEWGLIADIQPPDLETRVAILKRKAAIERIHLADDVAFLIASRIKSNIRELEGSLTRVVAFCALTGREMAVDLAQEVLSDLWGSEEKVISIDHIQRKVAEYYSLKPADLKARNRTKTIALPRQVAMYLSRQLTHASLAEVGRAFGGKDHTTVLHAVEKIHSLLQENSKLQKTIETLTQSLAL